MFYHIKNYFILNTNIRKLNENIKNDNLWLGRFYVKRKSKFSSCLVFKDKRTKAIKLKYNTAFSWNFHHGIKLWEAMNDFIINYCKVWSENPSPSIKTAIDYRKVGR